MTVNVSSIGSGKTQVTINATKQRVWEALTEKIGAWWPDDFYAGGTVGNRDFLLEAEAGGRMYESWGEGGGTLWGTVVFVEPEKTLQVIGNQFPAWGGPTQWYGSWTLSESDGGTLLEFNESAVGNVSDSAFEEKNQGWQYLWATLKSFIENKPAPVWGQ